MTEVFIGIDVGTQSTKAVAYLPASSSTATINNNSKGKIVGRSQKSYSILPNNGIDGRAEQDPQDWINAVHFVLKDLVAKVGLVVEVAPASSASSKTVGSSSSSTDDDANNNNNKDYARQQYILAGVGISGQQHGMVLLDSNYQPLRPAKLWCDVEATIESTWIRNYEKKKKKWDHVLPGFTSPKVLWTIKNEPNIWNNVKWCVLPHDYINLVLRGVHDNDNNDDDNDSYSQVLEQLNATTEIIVPTTDRGDASGSGIFDPTTNAYCMELVNAIDPSGQYAKSLPTILNPLDICGNLSVKWMKDIGLLPDDDDDADDTLSKDRPYIPISVGSGDNMCSALGVGCVQPGMAVLSLGTSGTIFGVSHSPPSSKVAPFADACGRYLPLVCVMSCTGVLNSVLDSFFNGCGDNKSDYDNKNEANTNTQKTKWTHADATLMAGQHPPGCYGITFLPYLTPGERTPDWPHASGAILGLTASNMTLATNTTMLCNNDAADKHQLNPMAGLVYRAAMEGITYLLAEGVKTMKEACGDGFQPKRLLVVGGGSHNQLWRQMLADVLDMELHFPKEKESAALGAAFQVGAAVEASRGTLNEGLTMEKYISMQTLEMEEVVRPTMNEETRQLYKEGMERYCKYASKLFGIKS